MQSTSKIHLSSSHLSPLHRYSDPVILSTVLGFLETILDDVLSDPLSTQTGWLIQDAVTVQQEHCHAQILFVTLK